MVDGGEQAAAFGAAFDRGLPALLGAVRIGVERSIPSASPATFALRVSLLGFVRTAEWFAELVLRADAGAAAPASMPVPDLEPIMPRRPAGHPQAPYLPS